MRVLFLKNDSDHKHVMWEVHDGPDRWWVAVWNVAKGGWRITSGKAIRDVSPVGPTGKRIIAAIEAHK